MNLFHVSRRDPVTAYEALVQENMTEKDKRDLEMRLLKPAPLVKQPVPPATAETKLTMYVKVYFDSMEDIQEFSRMVKVGQMTERTTRESQKILEALRAQENKGE